MTLPPDDQHWQEFLRKHRPIPPPGEEELEEQLMKAVEKSPRPFVNQALWTWPPALVAGLLMLLSSYRFFVPVPQPSNAVSLEAFFQDNWNQVVGNSSLGFHPHATPGSLYSNNVVPIEWQLEASAAR
jgi:hypothetical protein